MTTPDVYTDVYTDIYGVALSTVNNWPGGWSQPAAVTATPPPGTRSLPISVANTAGNWMVAVIGWRSPTTYPAPTFTVADDVHNWWEPAAPTSSMSSATGNVQIAVWIAPAARAASVVHIAPSGFTMAFEAIIFEFTGIAPWVSTAARTHFTNGGTTATVSLGAPSSAALVLTASAGDFDPGATTVTGTGWSAAVTGSTSNGSDHTADLGLAVSWQNTSSSTSATWTAGTSQNLAAVTVSILLSATAPAQPNPLWPATILEVGPGAGFQTAPDSFAWTAATTRYLTLDVQQGRQYELAALSTGEGVLTLDNPDGALLPPGSGSMTGISAGCPVRLRCAWQGGSWQVQFFGNGITASPQVVSGNIAATPGVTYTTTAYIACSVPYANGAVLTLRFFDVSNTQLLSVDSAAVTGVTATFSTVTATAPATTSYVHVMIRGTSTPPASTVFYASAAASGAGFIVVPSNVSWVAGNNATAVTLAPWLPDPAGAPNVTPWYIPFSGFIERLPQSWDGNLRGKVEAAVVDAWAGVNYAPNPILFTEILNDAPWGYWPCSDPAGSKVAANYAPGNQQPLQVYSSKYGTTGTTQAFGTNTSSIVGAQGTLLLTSQGSFRSTAQSGMWGTTGSGAQQKGYSLALISRNIPAISGGCTVEFWFQAASGNAASFYMLTMTTSKGINNAVADSGFSIFYFGGNFIMMPNWNINSTVIGTYNTSTNPLVHLALTFNTTTYSFYINGSLSHSGSFAATLASSLQWLSILDPGDQLSFVPGTPVGVAVSCPNAFFGHVALYSYILSQPRIATHAEAGLNGLAGELSSMRIERLLQAGHATSRRMIMQESGTNVDAVVSCQDIGGQPASASIGNITASLIPAMFLVTPNGDLFHLSKQAAWNQGIVWTLSDIITTGALAYNPDDVVFEFDPTHIANEIQITQLDNEDVIVPSLTSVQAASQIEYGTVSYQVTGYLEGDLTVALNFGPGLLDLADWLATQYGSPKLRLSSVTVDASRFTTGWPFILGASCGDMIQVTRAPIGYSQPSFSVIGRISQTKRSFAFGYGGSVKATLTCIIDPAPEYYCLTCDDPVRGVLNGTTNLLGW